MYSVFSRLQNGLFETINEILNRSTGLPQLYLCSNASKSIVKEWLSLTSSHGCCSNSVTEKRIAFVESKKVESIRPVVVHTEDTFEINFL